LLQGWLLPVAHRPGKLSPDPEKGPLQMFEYKLVPAPEKSSKHKGLKGPALFAATLEELFNTLGAEGWQYLRAETLPEEVRSGLTSRRTVIRNLLVFQRRLPNSTPPSGGQLPIPAGEDEPSLANLFLDPDDTSPPRA
jgi:hypothetical protein